MTKFATAVAWFVVIGSIINIVGGAIYLFGSFPEANARPMPLNPVKMIDRGAWGLLIGLALGVLCDISNSLRVRDE